MRNLTWVKCTKYMNLEVSASHTCILHAFTNKQFACTTFGFVRSIHSKGVLLVRFVFDPFGQECTTYINFDITTLTVIVKAVGGEAADSTFHKFIESICLPEEEQMLGVKCACSYWQLLR